MSSPDIVCILWYSYLVRLFSLQQLKSMQIESSNNTRIFNWNKQSIQSISKGNPSSNVMLLQYVHSKLNQKYPKCARNPLKKLTKLKTFSSPNMTKLPLCNVVGLIEEFVLSNICSLFEYYILNIDHFLCDMNNTKWCNGLYIKFRQSFAKETFSYDERLKN